MYIRTYNKIYKENEKSCIKNLKNKEYFFKDSYFSYRFENGVEVIDKSEDLTDLVDLIRFKTTDGKTHYVNMSEEIIEAIIVRYGTKNLDLSSFRYYIEVEDELILVAKLNNKEVTLCF